MRVNYFVNYFRNRVIYEVIQAQTNNNTKLFKHINKILDYLFK